MKLLTYRADTGHAHRDAEDLDPSRRSWGTDLVDRLAETGYRISLLDAVNAWEGYSRGMAAGWMDHHGMTGAEVLDRISNRLEESDASVEVASW